MLLQAEVLQFIIQVNTIVKEEYSQYIANLAAQNQDLQTQIVTLTAQLASI